MKLTTTLIVLFFTTLVFSQPGSNDPTFNVPDNGSAGNGYGLDGTVYATAVQSDGKIIAGGQFVTYNGVMKRRIIRLNQDGTLDPTFSQGTGLSGFAHAICIQDDGKIIVGGVFTSFNGISNVRIIRFNIDGSIDGTFTTGTGFNGAVYAIDVQSDGKIIVGGNFSSFNGSATTNIARLNANGTFDNSFVTGTGFNNTTRSIKVQQDDKVVIGGDFTSYNGSTNNYLLRLNADGTHDATFITGNGFNATVRTLSLQPDGKIITGGTFTTYNLLTNNRIIRINTDGSVDNSFITGTGFNEPLLSSVLQPDGKIIFGGEFTTYDGSDHVRLIRLNTDGTADANFHTGAGYDNFVESISLLSNEKIIVGGHFTFVNDINKNYITLLNSDGTIDHTFNQTTGLSALARSTTIQPDGKIIINGEFAYYNGILNKSLTRVNIDGSNDLTFSTGEGFNNTVWSSAVQQDGKIIAVGTFTSVDGVTRNRIARLNTTGSIDTSFDPGSGFNNMANVLAIQQDGKILVGGNYTTFNGMTQRRIVRLNQDGTIDNTFTIGTGFNDVVRSITIQEDGKIIIGGHFSEFNGTTVNYIVRLNSDGSQDLTFATNLGFDDVVVSTTLQANGKILIGGWFSSFNGTSVGKICRINSDGTLDSSFDSGTGFNSSVYTIIPQLDGKVNVAGQFNMFSGVQCNHIAQLNEDGSLNTNFITSPGPNAQLQSLNIQSDGKLIVVGEFTTYNLTPRTRIARIENCISTNTIDVQAHCGPYTWIDGIEYTSSNNTAVHTISNGYGCDSVITLNLTINEPTSSSLSQVACFSYTWPVNNQIYTSSGTYTHVIPNSNNCDSTITLNLTINTVDASVSSVGTTITANQTGATYQWIDCDSDMPIAGANDIAYTATIDGNYAVEVLHFGCTVTSDCIEINTLGIASVENSKWNVFPNPSETGLFTIRSSSEQQLTLEILTLSGTVIESKPFLGTSATIDLSNYAKGIYLLKIGSQTIRVVY